MCIGISNDLDSSYVTTLVIYCLRQRISGWETMVYYGVELFFKTSKWEIHSNRLWKRIHVIQ